MTSKGSMCTLMGAFWTQTAISSISLVSMNLAVTMMTKIFTIHQKNFYNEIKIKFRKTTLTKKMGTLVDRTILATVTLMIRLKLLGSTEVKKLMNMVIRMRSHTNITLVSIMEATIGTTLPISNRNIMIKRVRGAEVTQLLLPLETTIKNILPKLKGDIMTSSKEGHKIIISLVSSHAMSREATIKTVKEEGRGVEAAVASSQPHTKSSLAVSNRVSATMRARSTMTATDTMTNTETTLNGMLNKTKKVTEMRDDRLQTKRIHKNKNTLLKIMMPLRAMNNKINLHP